MPKSLYLKRIIIISSLLGLSACGGSSGDTSDNFPDAYLQFYNVSSNSAATTLVLDGDEYSSSTYGDTSPLHTLAAGSYELQLTWEDSDGQENTITELDVNVSDGHKKLLIMGGDFDSPVVSEYEFIRKDLEDEFYLHGFSAIDSAGEFDLYVAEAGVPFDDANFVGSLNYLSPEHFEYWAPEDDVLAWPEGDYVLFLTNHGELEPIFESQEVGFDFATDYVLAIRNSTGANDSNLVVDIILNSSTLTAQQNVTATAQFRVYSALSEDTSLDVSLSDSDEVFNTSVLGGDLSEFTAVAFGDYQISASSQDTQVGFDDRLMTLNQGDSKTVVIFEDPTLGLTSLSMEDSQLPQSFEHQISVANLLPDFNDLDVYFVRSDETIDSAAYKMTSLDYADSRSIIIPNDYYSVVVVYEDNLGIESLLYRSELQDFTEDAVYILTIEPDTLTGGYKANVAW